MNFTPHLLKKLALLPQHHHFSKCLWGSVSPPQKVVMQLSYIRKCILATSHKVEFFQFSLLLLLCKGDNNVC